MGCFQSTHVVRAHLNVNENRHRPPTSPLPAINIACDARDVEEKPQVFDCNLSGSQPQLEVNENVPRSACEHEEQDSVHSDEEEKEMTKACHKTPTPPPPSPPPPPVSEVPQIEVPDTKPLLSPEPLDVNPFPDIKNGPFPDRSQAGQIEILQQLRQEGIISAMTGMRQGGVAFFVPTTDHIDSPPVKPPRILERLKPYKSNRRGNYTLEEKLLIAEILRDEKLKQHGAMARRFDERRQKILEFQNQRKETASPEDNFLANGDGDWQAGRGKKDKRPKGASRVFSA